MSWLVKITTETQFTNKNHDRIFYQNKCMQKKVEQILLPKYRRKNKDFTLVNTWL